MAGLLRSIAIPLATRASVYDNNEGVNSFPDIPPVELPDLPDTSGGIWGWVAKHMPTFFEWGVKIYIGIRMCSWAGLALAALGLLYKVWADNQDYLYNFNWNMSDEEIDNQFANLQHQLMGQLGATTGSIAGFVMCGGLAAAFTYGVNKVFKFNDGAAVRILNEVGEEALDELRSNLHGLIYTLRNYAIRWVFAQLFKGTRRMLRYLAQDPNSVFSKMIKTVYGDGILEKLKKWGLKGQKPWSFASSKEEEYEAMKDKGWANYWEEYDEEFREACREAFYISSGTLDAIAMERNQILGSHEVIEVYPNRKIKDEYYVVGGPANLLESAITTTLRTHQTIETKDVGMLVGGEPVASNITTPGKPWARIVFSNSDTKKTKPTYIDLHNIKRSKWDDWEQIKLACGGPNGYQWGPYRVKALLPDNTEIACYAGSEAEGIDLIERFLPFVEAGDDLTAIQWHCGHEMRRGTRLKYDSTYKRPRKQIPWEFTIVNPTRVLNEENGRANRSGIYKDRDAFIDLHTDTKPENFAEKISELFRTPGPSN